MSKQISKYLLLAVIIASCKAPYGKPRLHISNPSVNLSTVPFDSSCSIRYTMINTGGTMLVIDTVTASCGCTMPAITRYTIPPMDSAELKVTFKPPDTGTFNKKVIIKNNTDSVFTVVSFYGVAQK
jgi:hypothetical protein